MVRRESIIEKEHVQGGKGTVYLHRVLLPEELNGHGRAYMRVVLPPGTSIGWHQHLQETEPYYILKGNGEFIDNDKKRYKVRPGDVCIIKVGQYHSMENNSDQDLEFMALIYNEPGRLT
jgi:quercetin dioxygenase-like cupin family protein